MRGKERGSEPRVSIIILIQRLLIPPLEIPHSVRVRVTLGLVRVRVRVTLGLVRVRVTYLNISHARESKGATAIRSLPSFAIRSLCAKHHKTTTQ